MTQLSDYGAGVRRRRQGVARTVPRYSEYPDHPRGRCRALYAKSGYRCIGSVTSKDDTGRFCKIHLRGEQVTTIDDAPVALVRQQVGREWAAVVPDAVRDALLEVSATDD